MRSEKIEYIRFDDLNTGILIEGKPYLVSYGSSSVFKQVCTPNGQRDLIKALVSDFRYNVNLETVNSNTVHQFSKKLGTTLIELDELDEDVSHIELFLNPSELGLIPFEILLNEDRTPKFINKPDGKPFILTRNFREKRSKKNKNIPETSRILFAYAEPTGFQKVPYQAHENALRYALRLHNAQEQLSVLANTTFEAFKKAITDASAKNKPFTHIHVLAHGDLLLDKDNPADFEYGIAFNSMEKLEDFKPTSNRDIKALFDALKEEHLPYLVNYMICDGANFSNGYRADKNPVQVTFKSGVPIVIGSQFPLSMDGSSIITKHLYTNLLQGKDIRCILGDIRTHLYKKSTNTHDWISLVAYTDLPKDYDLQLLKYRAISQWEILNAIRDKNSNLETEDDFIESEYEIKNSINILEHDLDAVAIERAKESYFLEHSGLIASAYKRLAEIEFIRGQTYSVDTTNSQKENLNKAMHWYKKAADKNQSHHWSSIQYLSLKIVLEGALDDLDYWYTTRRAALAEIEANDHSIWPYGTLMELYLLFPDTETIKVTDYLNVFLEKCILLDNRQQFIDSTRFQFLRYLDWWNSNDFKIPNNILASNKTLLKDISRQLKYYK